MDREYLPIATAIVVFAIAANWYVSRTTFLPNPDAAAVKRQAPAKPAGDAAVTAADPAAGELQTAPRSEPSTISVPSDGPLPQFPHPD